jgi:threonine dehydratase
VVQEGVVVATSAFSRAEELREATGATLVHPFDDPMVIAGAGTATRELLDTRPDLDRILVPCSGGGLLAGATVAAASEVEIIGVQPESANAFQLSLRNGRVTSLRPVTVADGLTAPHPGRSNFEIVHAAGVRIVTVAESSILRAMHLLVSVLRVVVEPAAAVPIAALLTGAVPAGASTGVLLSGSNVSRDLLLRVLSGEDLP